MVTSTKCYTITLFVILVCAAVIYLPSFWSNQVEDGKMKGELDGRILLLEEYNLNRPVKVSYHNQLWQDPNNPVIEEYMNRFEEEIASINSMKADDYIDIFDRYLPIGINNLITSLTYPLDQHSGPVHENLFTFIGVYAARKASNLRDALEIVIDAAPNDEPLHGAIVEAIMHENITNPSEIYQFIATQICFMKDYQYAENTYARCIKGAGVAVGKLYKNFDTSLRICGYFTNDKIQSAYLCSEGVFSIQEKLFEDLTACGSVKKFAPVCFMVQNRLYRVEKEQSCSWVEGNYTKKSCAWGFGTNIDKTNTSCSYFVNSDSEEEYLICLDGVLAVFPMPPDTCVQKFSLSKLSDETKGIVRYLCYQREYKIGADIGEKYPPYGFDVL